MDSTKVAIAAISVLGAALVAALGIWFISEQWEDIKTLGLVALILGGTVTIGGGGLWLKGRR